MRDQYYYNRASDDYLAHYGVKGMKWGVRRYQNPDGSLTEAGKKRYYGSSSPAEPSKAVKDTADIIKTLEINDVADDRNKHDRSPMAMMAFRLATDVAATVFNPAYAIYLGQDVARLGMAVKSVAKSKKFKEEREAAPIDKRTGFHKKTKELTEKEDLERVNPSFWNFDNSTKNNCMLCTSTYDLRKRGYDVEANIAKYGYIPKDVNKWYPKAKVQNSIGIDKLKADIVAQGNGARGNLMVTWKGGRGGHSVIYEVIDGQMMILDAQANKQYKNPDKLLKQCDKSFDWARLDNIPFDLKAIKEVAH